MTGEEIYKKNKKKSKILKILAPIVFWVCLVLSLVAIIFAIKNSFGNIREIIQQLDGQKFTGEELQQNYSELVGKWGEWTIGDGDKGFQIEFINIGKALFSGVMITDCILCVVFFACAFIVGKWLLPKISEQILQDNQDMVNLTILQNTDKKE